MKKIFKLLLIIIWLGIIFLFSNQSGTDSSNLTKGFLERFLWFINNDTVFFIIRKLAHLFEYFILGILIYNLLIEYKISKIILISVLFCIIFASLDEFHQLFIPGRSSKVLDVFIDTIGSYCGILLINLWNKKKSIAQKQ